MLVAAPLVGAQTAFAQYPPTAPTLTLSVTTVAPGQPLTFTARGFVPGRTVRVQLGTHHPIVLGTFVVDATGTVTGTVTIPPHIHHGWYVLRITETDLARSVATRIRILGAVGGPGGPGHPGHPGHPGDHGHQALPGAHTVPGAHAVSGASGHGAGLAATGSGKALAVGGTAAGLIAAGGGTMLAVRRRRSS
ncbi:hypothetical protein [Streptomyces sp. NPDC003710]